MVNEPSNGGETPLRTAACFGPHDVIKWWIASGREMNLGKPGDIDKTDAIGVAKGNGKTEVVSLRRDSRAMPPRQGVKSGWNWESMVSTTTPPTTPTTPYTTTIPHRPEGHLF